MVTTLEFERIELEESPVRSGFQLPLDGFVTISQGYNGPFSHFALRRGHRINDLRYSVDFAVAPGTLVRAAQDGEVFGAVDIFSESYRGYDIGFGSNIRANLVVLQHAEDSFTLYSHLAKDSLKVFDGDRVEKGQPIAKTGLVGWIGLVPHLHFQAINFIGKGYRSFPVEFDSLDIELEHSRLRSVD